MTGIDEDFLAEAEDDARCVAFIQAHLGQEMQERYTEELLYYFLDVIVEYYADSGVLDADPDDDDCVEIDLEQVARHMQKAARKDKMGDFPVDELLLIAQAELDYGEQAEGNEEE